MRTLVIFAVLGLAACTWDTFEDRREAFQRQVAKSPIGISPDYYLTKNGDDRVALVFGMGDDFEFCTELADLYMSRYPLDKYSCVPAQ